MNKGYIVMDSETNQESAEKNLNESLLDGAILIAQCEKCGLEGGEALTRYHVALSLHEKARDAGCDKCMALPAWVPELQNSRVRLFVFLR